MRVFEKMDQKHRMFIYYNDIEIIMSYSFVVHKPSRRKHQE